MSYWIAVIINAFYEDHIGKEREEQRKWNVLNNVRSECIAYHFWVGSLGKAGFPKHPGGAEMSSWELYEYWNSGRVDKKPWLVHTNKNLEIYAEEKEKKALNIISNIVTSSSIYQIREETRQKA